MVSFRLPDEHLDPFHADSRQGAPTNTSRRRRISPPPGFEHYASVSVFDSDDEDSSDESCFDFSFSRKPVTPPTPLSVDGTRAKTAATSLLTIGLKRYAETAAPAQALIDEIVSSQQLEQPAVTQHANDEYHVEQQTTSEPESPCDLPCSQEQNQEQESQPDTENAAITSNTAPAMAFSPAQHLRSGLRNLFGAVKHFATAMIKVPLNIIDELLPHPEPEVCLDNFYIPYTSSVYADSSNNPESSFLPDDNDDESDDTSGSDVWSDEDDDESDDDNATTTTTTPPIPIPLTAAQKEQKAEWENLRIPVQDARDNDSREIARAGPMGGNVKRSRHDQDGGALDKYVEEDDRPWWCCSCCAANTRWEFLCAGCGAHVKADCCQEVVEGVEGVDGVAGYGVAGSW